MRICIICSGFSYVYGGLEAAVFDLSDCWSREGHEVFILSGGGKKTGPRGVRLIKLPFVRSEFFLKIPLMRKIFGANEFEGLSLLPFAILCLIGANPDIVLSNGLSETLPSIILNIPSIMISQAPINLRYNTFKKVDMVIVNDFQSHETLRKCGINTQLLFNGVTKSVQETNLGKLRAKYRISNTSKVFLTVARLDTNKRINLLIDAFNLIEQEAVLIIVGDGPEQSALRKQASSINSKNRIFFIKPMPQEQLKELYQLCDVFTLPSKLEAMPLVLIEALSFGKIVVTNPAPEKKFILGKFGVFTNVENPYDYSESLIRATSLKIEANSASYINHMEKFCWTKISQQYIKVFDEVLHKRALVH
jgi:glycosyltransferase involved in cell wall biosynthesis